jgi:hypothetical protein
VEAFAYACEVSPEGVKLKSKVPLMQADTES